MKRRGNGEGSIVKRKDGLWMGQVTTNNITEKGKKKVTVYGKTKKEVQEKIYNIINQVRTNTYLEPSKMTLEGWMNLWLKDYASLTLKPTTYSTYQSFITHHINPFLGNIKLSELQTSHIQALIKEKSEQGRKDAKEGGLSTRSLIYKTDINLFTESGS